MNCVFCELPAVKERAVMKSAHSFAFLTNIPITIGHTLVVPNRCVKNIEDLSDEEVLDFLELRLKITKALRKTFGVTGFNYAWNEGKMAGQSVPHLHLHIVPRKEGDAGVYEYEPRKFLYRTGERDKTPEEELKTIAKMIAEHK